MTQDRRPPLALTLLTGSRLLFALAIILLTPWAGDRTWAVIVATVLVGLIEVTDLLDGYLARMHDAVTGFGKLFDPYTDSLSRLTVYWSLAVVGRCLVFVPLVMAARDISVAYIRLQLTRQGRDVAARWWGKLKAIVHGTGGLVLMSGPLWWGRTGPVFIWTISLLAVLVTLGSLLMYGILAFHRTNSDEDARPLQ
jgi:CDP-diacylglycerol--glycerol-3-phosphate 3-phosphatidyltransferase